MIVFGIGYVSIFAVFILLYWHAFRRRTQLQLNDLEVFDTRNSMQEAALNCSIGLISMALAYFGGRYSGLAGPVYMLLGVVMSVNGTLMGRHDAGVLKRVSRPQAMRVRSSRQAN